MKKLVFITGWAKWIWKACAKKFKEEWFEVAFNYLSSEKEALELEKEIWAKKFFWDMSLQIDIENIFENIKDEFWKYPDILVNNAWVVNRTKFPDLSWDTFEEILSINTVWPYRVSREFFLKNKENLEEKSIVFIWSLQWRLQNARTVDYAASKSAIHNMVSTLAKAMSPARINWVAPWFTKTDMHKWNLKRLEEEAKKSILKKFSMPSEIAEVVFFLANKWASSITGQTIAVDNWRSLVS